MSSTFGSCVDDGMMRRALMKQVNRPSLPLLPPQRHFVHAWPIIVPAVAAWCLSYWPARSPGALFPEFRAELG